MQGQRGVSEEIYLSRRVLVIIRAQLRLYSSMSTSVSIVTSILLTLVSILSSTHGKNIGEECTIDNSSGPSTPGICKLLQDCVVVYHEFLSGKTVNKKSCDFLNSNPIVCCPTIHVTTTERMTTSTTSRTNTEPSLALNRSRGSLARAICAENAKAVYGLEVSSGETLNNSSVNVSRCAVKTRKLILGGKRAEPKEFPHMTAIGFEDYKGNIFWTCGGSLISDKVVLTAARCTYNNEWGDSKWARVGDLNLIRTDDDALPQTIRIVERIRHPNYNRPSFYHDIAIVKLATSVIYNAWVRPACLPVDWPDLGNENKAIATGWSQDFTTTMHSNDLLQVTFPLISHASCNTTFLSALPATVLPFGIIDEWQICAGASRPNYCPGDNGGPLSIFNTAHECMYNIIGITSSGIFCDIFPNLYTRVYYYIPWIERTAWPELLLTKDKN